jgi:cobalt-zinc-cadmium efflux system outer membrane protein
MRHLWALLCLGGCVMRPEGEDQERQLADAAGKDGFDLPVAERKLPPLAPDARPEDFVRHACLANGELEARFFEWRAALERIPQESSQETTLELGFEHMFSSDSLSAFDRTTFVAGNDAMAEIVYPGKLATQGRIALEEARASARRFDQARLMLETRVVTAYVELAELLAEVLVREESLRLLEAMVVSADSRVRAGVATAQDLIKARTELALQQNEQLALQARAPVLTRNLNALVGRAALDAPVVATLPEPGPLPVAADQLAARLRQRSPELLAMDREVVARQERITRAEQEWIPGLSLSAGFTGSLSQMIGAAMTFPFVRATAIEAGIAQARAELSAAQARRRQAGPDLEARARGGLAMAADLDRQIALLRDIIQPQAEQAVELSRAAYTAGRIPLIELLDTRRTAVETRLMLLKLRAEREKTVAMVVELLGRD